MQVEIKIDKTVDEPKIIILTDEITEEIELLIKKITNNKPNIIAGFKDKKLEILEQKNIIRVYSANQKVYGVTSDGEYTIRLRLYEMEERLDKDKFVRISQSEIVNLKMVKNFDLSLAGTICVTLYDGTSAYVSRRYVSKIKKTLGI